MQQIRKLYLMFILYHAAVSIQRIEALLAHFAVSQLSFTILSRHVSQTRHQCPIPDTHLVFSNFKGNLHINYFGSN